MPTYDKTATFLRDWVALRPDQHRQFLAAVAKMVYDIQHGQGFREGLRIKGVDGHAGVFEMTWEKGNGRATLNMGRLRTLEIPISFGGVSTVMPCSKIPDNAPIAYLEPKNRLYKWL